MIEEVIEGRYTPVRSILEEQLAAWYGAGNFRILVGGTGRPQQCGKRSHMSATARRLWKMEGRST